jgi:phosphocarrier protein HPr
MGFAPPWSGERRLDAAVDRGSAHEEPQSMKSRKACCDCARKLLRGSPMASTSGVYQCLAEIVIPNRRGLHARASAAFVKTAEKYDAEIQVTKDDQTVGGSSIMGLMMLTAGQGSTIVIVTEGPEAEEALEALTELVENGFYEND